MRRPRKPSPQTRLVLDALAEAPSEWRHGYDIARQTGLASGSLYPILMRLAERGQLESRWDEAIEGRPPRHSYRITANGLAVVTASSERRTTRRPAEGMA